MSGQQQKRHHAAGHGPRRLTHSLCARQDGRRDTDPLRNPMHRNPLRRPAAKPPAESAGPGGVAGLVLAPGASAGRDQPALVAIDEAVSASGVRVERIDFPYRLAGRRAPDRPPVLIATVVSAAESLARTLGVAPRRVALGGRSMGGRMCSMAVADGLPAAALVLVSYPLHPPGKPEQLRTEHFGALEVPCLFVSGTRDAFGSPGTSSRRPPRRFPGR